MNMLMLVGVTSYGAGASNPGWVDSCALCLFIAGFVSLAVGAYLAFKRAPEHALRVHLRRD